eukprot:Rhum_TRINITY_DN19239_c0_g1::Rhum_TRINITY_DN19239_c0_g1_i1::g.169648::m.169648/K17279/REEP5_6; receptor expression-enhancing protein 5/6
MGLFSGLLGQFPTEIAVKGWLLLCGYKSFKAIESVDTTDDTQWLTFWTVLSVVQFAEFWTDILRRWLPYYNEAKLALIIWLGAFRGAHLIYEKALRPFLKEQEAKIDEQLDQVESQAKAQLKQ